MLGHSTKTRLTDGDTRGSLPLASKRCREEERRGNSQKASEGEREGEGERGREERVRKKGGVGAMQCSPCHRAPMSQLLIRSAIPYISYSGGILATRAPAPTNQVIYRFGGQEIFLRLGV